jgi:organic hydroperoxide reductase OsmC/OhrA
MPKRPGAASGAGRNGRDVVRGNLVAEVVDEGDVDGLEHAAAHTYASRVEGAPGAIPEELLVTGHAGCYNHALANVARKNGVAVESIATTAELTMGSDDQGSDGHGYSVEGIHLTVPIIVSTTNVESSNDQGPRCRRGRCLPAGPN